jgi:hypothetical protein
MWTLFWALVSCQTAIQISTIAETFDHVSAQTVFLATSFCGESWRRCSHGNHSINFRWQEYLLSCAEMLRKTCVTLSFQMCCQLQEITWRNGGHIEGILIQQKFTQMQECNVWSIIRTYIFTINLQESTISVPPVYVKHWYWYSVHELTFTVVLCHVIVCL